MLIIVRVEKIEKNVEGEGTSKGGKEPKRRKGKPRYFKNVARKVSLNSARRNNEAGNTL